VITNPVFDESEDEGQAGTDRGDNGNSKDAQE
jgi:hypothetical protein